VSLDIAIMCNVGYGRMFDKVAAKIKGGRNNTVSTMREESGRFAARRGRQLSANIFIETDVPNVTTIPRECKSDVTFLFSRAVAFRADARDAARS